MGTYGYLWYLWILVDIYGYLWILMGTYDTYGYLWILMEVFLMSRVVLTDSLLDCTSENCTSEN